MPSSILFSTSMSLLSSSKSKSWAFASIRCLVSDLGKTMLPTWMPQRSSTCAGVLPCFVAIALISSRSRAAPCAIGEYASMWMPRLRVSSRSFSCAKKGCDSIWFTTGLMRATLSKASRWSTSKLETPIERTLPASTAASICFHASINDCSPGSGEWIKYKSMYESCSFLNDSSMASCAFL